MPRRRAQTGDETLIDIASALLLLQGSIGVMSTIEALVTGAATGFASAAVVLATAGFAAISLWAVAALRRRSRRARRLVLVLATLIVLVALIDTALALVLAGRLLGPVPTLTRLVLPVATWRVLRRPVVRSAFARPAEVLA